MTNWVGAEKVQLCSGATELRWDGPNLGVGALLSDTINTRRPFIIVRHRSILQAVSCIYLHHALTHAAVVSPKCRHHADHSPDVEAHTNNRR
jgi:hypothetical protein